MGVKLLVTNILMLAYFFVVVTIASMAYVADRTLIYDLAKANIIAAAITFLIFNHWKGVVKFLEHWIKLLKACRLDQ